MKRLLPLFLVFLLAGCASVNVPNYIQDKHPYKKSFYGNFDDILDATKKTLEEYGWRIASTSAPSVFERAEGSEHTPGQQILLFTELKQTSFFVGTKYSRINVYLREGTDNSTEVEIRYVTVNSMSVKNFYKYRSDHFVERVFKRIDQLLK